MFSGTIPLVPGKTIPGKNRIQLTHNPVPGYFGKDGRRGNGLAPGIPIGNGPGGIDELRQILPINQQEFRRIFQDADGFLHGKDCCLKNIDFINLILLHDTDSEITLAVG